MFDLEIENSEAVEAQAENVRVGDNIWNTILRADLERLQQMIETNGIGILQDRGPVGECPLHLAFLYNSEAHTRLIDYIISCDPLTPYAQYAGEEYRGENCLHIAIINQNLALVEKLMALPGSHQLLSHVCCVLLAFVACFVPCCVPSSLILSFFVNLR